MSGTPLAAATTLAHAGGIPEIASVAVPLLLLGAILYAGRRRARAEQAQTEAEGETGDSDVSS